MTINLTKRLQLEAQRTANTQVQADLRNKLFNSPYPHHKTEEGQKMILDLLAGSERVGRQIKAELDGLAEPIQSLAERNARVLEQHPELRGWATV